MKLVLFDIDNTIFGYKDIKFHPKTHIEAFKYCLKSVFGIDAGIDEFKPFSGKIDNQIMRELLISKGLKESIIKKKIKKAVSCMASHYKKNYKKEKMYVHQGIRQILDELQKKKSIVLGVITGNVSQIGMIKLKRFSLENYFRVFGFGDKAKDRNELIKETTKKYNKVFVIGDTIHDINSGKYINATTIAVATGPYSKNQLKSADYVFKDFKDYKKLIKIIENA